MVAIRWLCLDVAAGVIMAALAGCAPPMSDQKMLQSTDALERAKGCKLAAETGDKAAVPLLVDRLEDEDIAVRVWADLALRQITGKDFGYREADTPANRAAAIGRWRDYANSSGKAATAGGGK